MKIFKFGGASIQDADRIKNMANILQSFSSEKLVLVVSALGKTTNALELVADAHWQKDLTKAKELFSNLEVQHNALAQDLMKIEEANICIADLQNIYAEADWILHDAPVRSQEYYYDQLVCLGEMMSTTLVSHYLRSQQLPNNWVDIRDVIRTDQTWRDAKVDLQFSEQQCLQKIQPLLAQSNFVITQGFIGCTDENESTTLGREGSDYTAALLANFLDAEQVSIWKDVQGLLSGDPKIFKDVVEIPKISFYEVIEMAYYGAQVIHPKTIKPLQNKNIPLFVRCFLNKDFPGTEISNDVKTNYPPILVLKKKQTLLQVFTKDFSFITDDKLSEIYTIFHDAQARINIIQNAAISFLACIDENEAKLNQLYKALEKDYTILRNEHIQLLTIRHYTQEAIDTYIGNAPILLEQKSRNTIQVLLKEEQA
jgi:aspartate kinase